ncbi:MAG: regulatory protein RecX [Pseudomonadota bacterium]
MEERQRVLAEARRHALDYLARREHAPHELGAKLAHKGYAADVVADVLAQLTDERLLSEERFVEAYIRARSDKGYGPVRIRQELRERRVAEPAIAAQLRECGVDWFELAAQVRGKKFGSACPADYKERAKQQRFLHYRGFTSEQISAALGVDD